MSSFDISLEEFRRRQFEHSTTPKDQRKRCPECKSVNIIRKTTGQGGPPSKVVTTYRCGHCHHHFDTPAPPEEAEE